MAIEPDAAPAAWPVISIDEAHARLTAPGMPHEIEEREIRGQRLRVWKNALPSLRDVFVAARAAHRDKTFLVYEDERASVEAFARAALAIAEALAADGVRKGDRVAIAMRNVPEWAAAFYGTVLVGGIATSLNAWWTGEELAYGLTDSGAKVVFVDAERLERLRPHLAHCPDLTRVWVSRSRGDLGHALASRLEDLTGAVNDWARLPERPLPEVALEPEDDATIFYTSGTTGRPKGALGTHRNSLTTLMAGPMTVQRNFLRRGEAVPTPDPDALQRAMLLAIPLFHTTGCQVILNGALANGTKLVMMRKWDTEQAMGLIERERITTAGGVPTIAWQIVEHPRRAQYDLSSIESMSYGGAPAASELVRRIKAVFPMAAPGTGWGMSETSATFTHHSNEDYVNRPDSAGPALPIGDMKIVDVDGSTLPPNTVGELWVRGPNVVKGYWGKPEATAATFVDGWLRTGDLARLDEEGFLFIVDRMKDMIIRGGENIYCIEVEEALYRHPAVMDAAVVPLPHRTLGEEPAAVVTLKPGAQATEAELRGFVGQHIAAFKVPVRIVFHAGPLPRNPNGKILKKELRAMFG
jgi:long-chain acyl-CoA synthetase